MEIKENQKITKNMKDPEKEDKFSLIKGTENKIEVNNKLNRMRDDLKVYIMDNRRIVYHRLEGMEPTDPFSSFNQNFNSLEVIQNRNKSNNNIGTNIVLFKKYVLGTKRHFFILIGTMLGMGITWFGWAFTNNNYYSFMTYLICFSSYFLTNYYMFLSFLIEPGIIPRNCPQFLKKNFENLEENKEENKDENKNEKKEENKDENKEENKEDEKNKEDIEVIPRIFRERFCVTCNIVRPPGTSHCRECNNCVQNFDHHCYYISNCVGKRNHKYFYLFLIWGTIGSIKMVILGFFTIYNVYITNASQTISIYFHKDKTLFMISLLLLGLCIFFSLGGFRSFGSTVTTFLIGFGILFYLFYKHLHGQKDIPFYYNPLLILFYVASIFFFCAVFGTFLGQTYHISSGYTIKQNASIKEELVNIYSHKSNNKVKNEFIRARTFKERLNNVMKLLKRDLDESLIVPERDLVEKI